MAEATTLITDAELIAFGLPGDALSVIDVAVRDASRAGVSAVALGYIKKRATLPLISWGDDIKRAAADLCVYDLMTYRGFDPGSNSGAVIVKRNDDAVAWLRDVARGIVEPVDMVDSTPDTDEQGPLVSSDTAAGWSWPTTSAECD